MIETDQGHTNAEERITRNGNKALRHSRRCANKLVSHRSYHSHTNFGIWTHSGHTFYFDIKVTSFALISRCGRKICKVVNIPPVCTGGGPETLFAFPPNIEKISCSVKGAGDR